MVAANMSTRDLFIDDVVSFREFFGRHCNCFFEPIRFVSLLVICPLSFAGISILPAPTAPTHHAPQHHNTPHHTTSPHAIASSGSSKSVSHLRGTQWPDHFEVQSGSSDRGCVERNRKSSWVSWDFVGACAGCRLTVDRIH